MGGNGRAVWAEAAARVTAFLAGCCDYGQSVELAADLAALRAHGLDRQFFWRTRFASAEQALGSMRRFEAAEEAERVRQAEAFLASHRPEPLLERGKGTGINAGHRFGRSNPAERVRREANRAARTEANIAAAERFGCGKKGGGNGKRRAA